MWRRCSITRRPAPCGGETSAAIGRRGRHLSSAAVSTLGKIMLDSTTPPATGVVAETPATVLMMPSTPTSRRPAFVESAINRFPYESTAIPVGPLSVAEVAGPPSPVYPAVPVPATVVMLPSRVTFRTMLFPVSAIYKAPEESTARPCGLFNGCDVAIPVGEVGMPSSPVPA